MHVNDRDMFSSFGDKMNQCIRLSNLVRGQTGVELMVDKLIAWNDYISGSCRHKSAHCMMSKPALPEKLQHLMQANECSLSNNN